MLIAQFHLIQAIRNFFNQKDFLDVLTPPMVENPGMETHIHPFAVARAINGNQTNFYLHTSPEFHMKKLLADGLEKIFTISYCFRDEVDISPIHRRQFVMLEWYRANARYEKIMDDCEELIKYCAEHLAQKGLPVRKELINGKFQRMTIAEIFRKILNIEILDFLEINAIYHLLKNNFPEIAIQEGLAWDDYYFLLFLNKIEPELVNYPYLLLYEFPCHLSALSTIKDTDTRVCERFEIFLNGIELCNCFNELRDLNIQKKRFADQREEKKKLYNYQLPEPSVLYQALEKGLPLSSGNALGVERLLKAITGISNPFWE